MGKALRRVGDPNGQAPINSLVVLSAQKSFLHVTAGAKGSYPVLSCFVFSFFRKQPIIRNQLSNRNQRMLGSAATRQ